MTARPWTALDFAVIPHVIAEHSKHEERLVQRPSLLLATARNRADGVWITNFRAAARAIHDAAACAGILNTLPAGPCRIIPQQEEVSIAPSSPGSNEVNKICEYAETTAS
jgi:hypothetical protein